MAVQNPRPNPEADEAAVVVGGTVSDDQLLAAFGAFGDDDDGDEGGEARPAEVALQKQRTWG